MFKNVRVCVCAGGCVRVVSAQDVVFAGQHLQLGDRAIKTHVHFRAIQTSHCLMLHMRGTYGRLLVIIQAPLSLALSLSFSLSLSLYMYIYTVYIYIYIYSVYIYIYIYLY